MDSTSKSDSRFESQTLEILFMVDESFSTDFCANNGFQFVLKLNFSNSGRTVDWDSSSSCLVMALVSVSELMALWLYLTRKLAVLGSDSKPGKETFAQYCSDQY